MNKYLCFINQIELCVNIRNAKRNSKIINKFEVISY